MTTYVCDLADADRVAGCGGKAAQLARSMREGLPVPPGFVVTSAALRLFLDHNALSRSADEVSALLEGDSPEGLDAAADALRARVLGGDVPASLRESLEAWQARLSPKTLVIVRSSALGEDGATASFAGQLDSILDVAELVPALLACWASYWSRRSLHYQRARGVRLGGMGAIVQEQVRPVHAGVLFTVAPDSDDLLVEFCRGHGEALVQGRVDPGRVAVSRADRRVRRLAWPEEVGEVEDEVFLELARLGLRAEAIFGAPQDIEWARDAEGRLWLVQSRPITTHRERVLWSNANVNENYPEPISPLLYSVALESYYHYFRNLALAFGLSPARVATVEQPLRQIIGVHGARMYYQLTNIHAVLRAAPFGERLANYFSAFTGAEPPPAAGERPSARWAWFEATKIAVQAGLRFRRLPKRVVEFERAVDAFADLTSPSRLPGASRTDLHAALRGFLDIRFHRWTPASLADAGAMISYGLLRHVLRREFPEAEQAALHNTLLKGLTDLVSGKPMAELWKLSRLMRDGHPGFEAALDAYSRDWGFRRSGELMLTVPDFQERPEPLLDILRAYAALDGESPEERLRKQQSEREAETRRVLGNLRGRRLWRWLPWPTTATVVRRLLNWCQTAIGLRERARMRQALLYTRLRGVALAIGRQLTAGGDFDRPEDVFFLTHQELNEFLSGSAMFPHHVRDLVRLRRKAHAELSAVKPPDRITLPSGAYLPPSWREDSGDVVSGAEQMTGVGACGGSVTGSAAVLTDVVECGVLKPGDILVTRQTDPGWGPAFLLIRGLVLERGGMLSHGAILAREYGIPTVVGVPGAVARIRTGQTLHVDGDRGVIRLVDR
jgi:pyruvate,water dikinase